MWAMSLDPQLEALDFQVRRSFELEVEQELGMSYREVDDQGVRGTYWHPDDCKLAPGLEGYHYFMSSQGFGVYFDQMPGGPDFHGTYVVRKLDIPEAKGIRGIVNRVKPRPDRNWLSCTHPRRRKG